MIPRGAGREQTPADRHRARPDREVADRVPEGHPGTPGDPKAATRLRRPRTWSMRPSSVGGAGARWRASMECGTRSHLVEGICPASRRTANDPGTLFARLNGQRSRFSHPGRSGRSRSMREDICCYIYKPDWSYLLIFPKFRKGILTLTALGPNTYSEASLNQIRPADQPARMGVRRPCVRSRRSNARALTRMRLHRCSGLPDMREPFRRTGGERPNDEGVRIPRMDWSRSNTRP